MDDDDFEAKDGFARPKQKRKQKQKRHEFHPVRRVDTKAEQ